MTPHFYGLQQNVTLSRLIGHDNEHEKLPLWMIRKAIYPSPGTMRPFTNQSKRRSIIHNVRDVFSDIKPMALASQLKEICLRNVANGCREQSLVSFYNFREGVRREIDGMERRE